MSHYIMNFIKMIGVEQEYFYKDFILSLNISSHKMKESNILINDNLPLTKSH